MVSSPASRLTALQRELVRGFFARERRFFLTGGAALAGFYLGHRETEDLGLFSPPGPDLAEAAASMTDAAHEVGAEVTPLQRHQEFRRLLVFRGAEQCKVDLVIDRAPMLDVEKADIEGARVDTLREITANKICTVLGRSEIKDVLDLRLLLARGQDLKAALEDAARKEGGADAATLAWLLDQIKIAPEALLPGGHDPTLLEAFRRELVVRLRAIALEHAAAGLDGRPRRGRSSPRAPG